MRTGHRFRNSILLLALLPALIAIWPGQARATRIQVYPGIDVLLRSQGGILSGRRIGLITHRAATGSGGWPTLHLLKLDRRFRLVALFAPEHGLDGTLPAGTPVPTQVVDNVPVFSLYAASRQPSPEMLAGVDALVVDLQDVGARAYTYASTMALAMRAAAAQGMPVVVLDRPNPLGGERVDGPVLDLAFSSFIGLYPIPAVHGMTIGELALLFNREFGIGADLTVIPMDGWHPSMHWEDTGLEWVRPSPAITSPVAAQLHASTGMLEGTNLTVGAGGTVPFETVAARWLDGDLLAERLNARGLPGVRFAGLRAGPPDRRMGGVRLVLTDARQFRPATTALHILQAIREQHPGWLDFAPPRNGGRYRFDLVWGTDTVREMLQRGEPVEQIIATWTDGLQRFLEIRSRHLLYARAVSPRAP